MNCTLWLVLVLIHIGAECKLRCVGGVGFWEGLVGVDRSMQDVLEGLRVMARMSVVAKAVVEVLEGLCVWNKIGKNGRSRSREVLARFPEMAETLRFCIA